MEYCISSDLAMVPEMVAGPVTPFSIGGKLPATLTLAPQFRDVFFVSMLLAMAKMFYLLWGPQPAEPFRLVVDAEELSPENQRLRTAHRG